MNCHRRANRGNWERSFNFWNGAELSMCLQNNPGSDGGREKTWSQGASRVKGDRLRRRSSVLWVLGEFLSSWWHSSIVCRMNFISCLLSRCSQHLSVDSAFPNPPRFCEGILRGAAVSWLSSLYFKCWSPRSQRDGIGDGSFGRRLGLEEVLMVEHHNEEKDTKGLAPSFTKWAYKR